MDTLLRFFKKHNLEFINKTFVLAVSTGIDSSVLLDMFIRFRNEFKINIVIAHVNHHRRAQSEIEKDYILNYAKEENIKCVVKDLYFEKTNNFQEEARKRRYMFFEEVIKEVNGDYLVLAHHATDNTETVLMRILRGSSLKGYAGINSYNSINKNDLKYQIIRPLLELSRFQIKKYQEEYNVRYFDDESNFHNDYTRNRIRNTVLPVLSKETSNLDQKILEFSNTLYQASLIIDNKRDEIIRNKVIFDGDLIKFSRSDFYKLESFMQEEMLFELLKCFQLSKANILELIKLIYSKNKNYYICFKNLFGFSLSYDLVTINKNVNEKTEDNSLKDFSLIIDDFGKHINESYIVNDTFNINVTKIEQFDITNLYQMCYNIDDLPITIRTRRDGDRIKLSNGYKKVNDLFIDLKISKEERNNKLLVVDKNNEILMIFGLRKSEVLKSIKLKEENIIKISLEENRRV